MPSLSRLIAAATLVAATALAPRPAAAEDRRGRRERDRHEQRDREDRREPARGRQVAAPPQVPAHVHVAGCGHDPGLQAPTAWIERDDLRWDGQGWVRAGWERREHPGLQARARELRSELAGLERERAEYHGRYARDPVRLGHYDARWLDLRAELEQELQRITWYAAR